MSGRLWALALLCSGFALLHCGGTVTTTLADGGSGGSAGQAGRSAGHAGQSSSQAGGGAGSLPVDAGFDEYVDPGCPDAGQPTQVNNCDPFALVTTCPEGQGCYPFVDQPLVGCAPQMFGTVCSVAGTGRQGEVCGDGTNDCASGFVCVVGAQPGKHCVQLCLMSQVDSCPRGMICGELDVEGYGVCS
jgi:hypothetical protein